MGPIIPAPDSQFRPPLSEINPNVRKGDSTEKRRRASPKKRFRPRHPQSHCGVPSLIANCSHPQGYHGMSLPFCKLHQNLLMVLMM